MPENPRYDAIIVGAGLGGLTTAALLARAGWSVLALEAGGPRAAMRTRSAATGTRSTPRSTWSLRRRTS